ncbi:hypothetical protein QLX67_10830, partial [Balneolaceae bacterium ANBcel3]|nr:hypothetical protein [Balneolaceae bacterium ANBcel3]
MHTFRRTKELDLWKNEIYNAQLQSRAMCIAVFDIKKEFILFENKAFTLLAPKASVHSLRNPDF